MDVSKLLAQLHRGEARSVARAVSLVEDLDPAGPAVMEGLDRHRLEQALVIGITGPPGAGKSTLTGALVRQLRQGGERVGIIAIDPSSPLTGGALLGDRIRMMEHALDRDVVVRSMATRGRLGGLCSAAGAAVRILAASGCRVILIETVGVGQSEMDIATLADITLMVLAPGFGDDIQAMKAGILEVVDLLVINKADLPGAERLLLDLGRETVAGSERVLQTVASEHRGCRQLLERILQLEQELRQGGGFSRRRSRSHERETLDWVMELLKKRMAGLVHEQHDLGRDPRTAATKLVEALLPPRADERG